MISLLRLAAVLLPVTIAACASSARADDRCTGTLCDLYYGKSSSFDDKPAAAAPTPVTVPRQTIMGMFSGGSAQQPAAAAGGAAAPAKRPMVGVGGGGLAAWARGEAPEQCSGTLCDLYYGKSSSFDDEKPAAAAAAPAASSVATAPAAGEVIADTAQTPLRMEGFQTRPEPARCVGTSRDPWSCFR